MEERLMRGTSTFRTKSPSANSTVLCRTVMVAWTSFIIMPQHRKAKKSCVTWLSNIWTPPSGIGPLRSEEHTSELQSLMRISYAVFCLKKKNTYNLTKVDRQTHNTQ